MKICFVANYSKTFLFESIAARLKELHAIDVCWIVVNRKLYDHLSQRYDASDILYLDKSFSGKTGDPVGDFGIHELLYGDRVWRHDMKTGEQFLVNIQKPIHDFISRNNIQAFFGEHTWAHELVIVRMAKMLDISYLDPQVVRIPNGRFGFFSGESHEELFEVKPLTYLNGAEIFKVQRPSYFRINNEILQEQRSLKGRIDKARRFFTNENIDKSDPTIISNQLLRFRIRTQMEINKESYYFVKRSGFESFKNEKYVFHTLHMQPESTIDVFGRYYEDQYQMIINLWRKLPLGWKLVIKEHTNAIGDRPLSFYKKVGRLPNVIIADETINSHDLIESAQLVATVAGTVAYEAALLRIPAVIFSNAFFCRLSGCLYKTLKELAECSSLCDWVEESAIATDNRRAFCQHVINNSFEGIMSDPISDPSVLEAGNISNLAEAFATVLNKIRENAASYSRVAN